ncbi:MAG: copper amine oxidase N-terminal domain-containing protein, partial [Caldisericia bacterium]|nr:copper amine oxidase N-terminal domain-containing protein [Caldisericia bacterium]
MKKLKIFFSFLLSVIFFSSVIVYGDNIIKTIQVAYRNLSIQVNGKIIQSEQEPFIYEGRTFAPLRTIAEAVNKNVEWDNEKNQVNITDKEPASLCFPIHKIGERVEKFPFALTITKIYTGKKDKHGTSFIFPEELLFVDLIIENESTQYKYLQGMRPFSIWDDKGNLLAILNENYL